MVFPVKDKVCLVTGSGKSIGKEVAKRLLESGAKVCVSDISEKLGLATAEEFQKRHPLSVTFCRLDITNADQWKDVFDHCEDFFKAPVDLLVNNAGVAVGTTAQIIDVNLTGLIHGSSEFVRRNGKSKGGNGGRIVNVASLAAFENSMHFEVIGYSTSKAAVVGFTRHFGDCLPVDNPWEVEGIKGFAVCPWFVETDLVKDPRLPGRSTTGVRDQIMAKTFNAIDLHSKSNILRYLQTPEVVDVIETALNQDVNGSTFTVLPNIPTINLPNVHRPLMMMTALFAKILVLCRPQTKQVDIGHVVMLLSFLFVATNFLFGILFHSKVLN